MPQVDRQSEAFHVRMQKRVDVALAANVLYRALQGEELRPQQVTVALAIYNKTVPTLAAVQIEMQVKQAQDQLSLVSEALEAGLDPSQLFDMPEKKVIEHDSSGKPPTPGIDE